MKKLILLISMIFLVSLVIAAEQDSLGTFPVRTNIDLIQTCTNKTSFCDLCNITSIKYPDSTLLHGQGQMTDRGQGEFNLTLPRDNVTQLGDYQVSGFCKSGNEIGNWAYSFTITTDGLPSTPFPIQFSIFIVGIALIIVGTTRRRLRIFKQIGGIITIVMGVYTLFPGYAGLNHDNLLGLLVGFSGIGGGLYWLLEDLGDVTSDRVPFEEEEI